MLELKNITLYLPQSGRMLCENLSFVLGRGEKAVLIGEEGNGKSTLLKYIADPSAVASYCEGSGQVIFKGTFAYLPQFCPAQDLCRCVRDYLSDVDVYADPALPWQLGLSPELWDSAQPLATLSGGERVKLMLYRLLLTSPDILLLDEPTNDIDLDTLTWLENFLRHTKLTVLYISHDELLIEHTAQVILHMEQLRRKSLPRLAIFHGPYRDYLTKRRRSFDHQNQIAQKQREDYQKQMARWQQIHDRVEHEQRAVSRQDPHGGQLLKKKMKAVQSMGRRFEREAEDFTDFVDEEEAILVRFDPAITLPAGKTVLELDLPLLTAGDKVLAKQLRLHAKGPAHIGITGHNGAGKSTLLESIRNALLDRADLRLGFMPQNYARVLPFDKSPVDYLAATYSKAEVTRARTYLGSMRFTHEEMTKPIAALSGGQQAKLIFLDMVLQGANVLLLDEPTRNFSPLSCPVIRQTLSAFGGCIISVSHDRKYLAEVCTEVYELTETGLVKHT